MIHQDKKNKNKKNERYKDKRKENSDANKILEDIKLPFKSKNKTIRNISKENYDDDKILRDIRSLSESDVEYYYKPIRTDNAFSSNYIEYESNRDIEKIQSIEYYLDKVEPYLKLYDHKTQGEWKIQLTVAINFISSKDSDKTCTIHTKSDNI